MIAVKVELRVNLVVAAKCDGGSVSLIGWGGQGREVGRVLLGAGLLSSEAEIGEG